MISTAELKFIAKTHDKDTNVHKIATELISHRHKAEEVLVLVSLIKNNVGFAGRDNLQAALNRLDIITKLLLKED